MDYIKKLSSPENLKVEAIVIGGTAINYHFKNYRPTKDIDLIATPQFILKYLSSTTIMKYPTEIDNHITLLMYGNIYDIWIATNNNSSMDLLLANQNSQVHIYEGIYKFAYANTISLIQLLVSHIWWPSTKTPQLLDDLHKLLGDYMEYAEFINDPIVIKRRAEKVLMSGGMVPGANIKLTMSSEEFLEKPGVIPVEKIIAHDDIHLLVSITPGEPIYKKILKDPNSGSAACSKQKFYNDLTPEERLNDVREEAMVLALERFIFTRFIDNYQVAYLKALCKICTITTSGWFRDFAIENWPNLKDCPKDLVQIAKPILEKVYPPILLESHKINNSLSYRKVNIEGKGKILAEIWSIDNINYLLYYQNRLKYIDLDDNHQKYNYFIGQIDGDSKNYTWYIKLKMNIDKFNWSGCEYTAREDLRTKLQIKTRTHNFEYIRDNFSNITKVIKSIFSNTNIDPEQMQMGIFKSITNMKETTINEIILNHIMNISKSESNIETMLEETTGTVIGGYTSNYTSDESSE
jgi:hypothetical protein